jgi:UDP-N-acetyl-D-glucosamine dehydrogenase
LSPVNIALGNELAQLCDRLAIDVWEVIDAASSKPFGFMRFDPGPGMGGHCLPVDPFYLAFKARQHDFATEFVELAGKINQSHPLFCVSKIQRALNDRELAVKGSNVLIVGVAYKAGVADLRESPALKIIDHLRELGAAVCYHDPHVPELPERGLSSVPLADAVATADAVAIVTAHPGIDYADLAAAAALVVDFRGVTRGLDADNVVLL